MRVMGIDPGLAHTGLAIVEEVGGCLQCLHTETVKTKAGDSTEYRLKYIFDRACQLSEEQLPAACSMESTYVMQHVKPAMQLAEVRGALYVAAAISGLEVWEYAPRDVKKTIVGYGNASKEQVHSLLSVLLGRELLQMSSHETDAIALAITHIHSSNTLTQRQI